MTRQDLQGAAPRCAACGDVVGVYEPAVVVLVAGEAVETSRLRLGAVRDVTAMYHRACHPAPRPGRRVSTARSGNSTVPLSDRE